MACDLLAATQPRLFAPDSFPRSFLPQSTWNGCGAQAEACIVFERFSISTLNYLDSELRLFTISLDTATLDEYIDNFGGVERRQTTSYMSALRTLPTVTSR